MLQKDINSIDPHCYCQHFLILILFFYILNQLPIIQIFKNNLQYSTVRNSSRPDRTLKKKCAGENRFKNFFSTFYIEKRGGESMK
jgi:hypothetical protein